MHRPDLLAGQPERLPARGQQDDVGAERQDLFDQGSHGAEDVLAVVEDEEQVATSEIRGHRLLDRQPVPPLHPQGGRHRVPDRGAVGERRELAEPDAAGEPGPLALRHFESQPGLADPSRAGERHQRGLAEGSRDGIEFLPPAHEPRAAPGQVRRSQDGWWQQRGIMCQQLTVHGARRRRGLHAELLDQHPPQAPVHSQGLGLTSGDVQGAHQQDREPLPLRIAGDQVL
jgi:hypothetical protein